MSRSSSLARKWVPTEEPTGSPRDPLDEFGAERVIDTPISEAAIVGAAVGSAMTGLRPVAELMYVDFFGSHDGPNRQPGREDPLYVLVARSGADGLKDSGRNRRVRRVRAVLPRA